MIVNVKKFIYAGMFVHDEYKSILENVFIENIPNACEYIENWKMYLDHCTMIFNKGNLNDKKSERIIQFLQSIPDDSSDTIVLDAIGRFENVYAFRVKSTKFIDLHVKNKTPHVTAYLNPLTNKPVDSNKITEWQEIEPVHIKITYKVIYKK